MYRICYTNHILRRIAYKIFVKQKNNIFIFYCFTVVDVVDVVCNTVSIPIVYSFKVILKSNQTFILITFLLFLY